MYNFTDANVHFTHGLDTFAMVAFANGYDRGRSGRGPLATSKLLKDLGADNAVGLLPEHAKIFGQVHRAGNEAGWLARREVGLGDANDEKLLGLIKLCGGLIVVDGEKSYLPAAREGYCNGPAASRVLKLARLYRIDIANLRPEERARINPFLGSLTQWYRLGDVPR